MSWIPRNPLLNPDTAWPAVHLRALPSVGTGLKTGLATSPRGREVCPVGSVGGSTIWYSLCEEERHGQTEHLPQFPS